MEAVRRISSHGSAWAIEGIKGMTPLTTLASKNRVDILMWLIQHYSIEGVSASLNHADRYGNTTLHYVVLRQNAEAIDLLCAKGASWFIANNAGQTAADVHQCGSLLFDDPDATDSHVLLEFVPP